MARRAKPWWWSQMGEWCVTVRGKRHRLGVDKEAAETEFHKLMANPAKPVSGDSVAAIIDKFLDYCQTHNAQGTYEWYKKYLQDFIDHLSPKTLKVNRLKKHHVTTWLDAHPTWGDSVKRGAMTAVGRVFNWAVAEDYLPENPLHHKLKKPPSVSRDQVIAPPEYIVILKHVKGGFRDLLVVAWETGARPQELTKVEARHVDLKNGRWVFPVKESKGKKSQRIVYLSKKALAITTRLVAKHPAGPLFRNRDGELWTPYAVANAFGRLKRKVGIKHRLYDFRFSYATNAVKRGIDLITLQHLMGHKDLTMLSKVYARVSQDIDHMRQAAEMAMR